MLTQNNSNIPIIVAVSGHRDLVLTERQVVIDVVEKSLLNLETLVPDNIPLILLSGLAEGADQLVAEVALSRSRVWTVVGVVPMPWEDYLEDFADTTARMQLEKLRARCSHIIEIPWASKIDLDIENKRDQQYRNQSIYVVRQSQVVIALWDGDGSQSKASGACGTSYVVRLCNEGPPPVDGEILATAEKTCLIHVPVHRLKTPHHELQNYSGEDSIAECAQAFSIFAQSTAKLQSVDVLRNRRYLLPDDELAHVDAGTQLITDVYAQSDTAAQVLQGQRNRAVLVASIASVVGAISQALQSMDDLLLWMILYGAAVGLAYLLFVVFFKWRRIRIEERFLEYRALAEGLRIQIFWRLAGLNISVSEHYLQLAKSEVGWVREGLRNFAFMANLLSAPTVNRSVVKKQWINDQLIYYMGRSAVNPHEPTVETHAQHDVAVSVLKYFMAKKKQRPGGKALDSYMRNIILDKLANVSLFAGASLVGLLVAGKIFPLLAFVEEPASTLSATFFLIAGVIKGYIATMGYDEQAQSYEKMGQLFQNAHQYLINYSDDEQKYQACIFSLGRHALAENADWLIQHRRNAFSVD